MIIEAVNLTRDYKVYKGGGSFNFLNYMLGRNSTIKRVVDNVNISINEGEVVGYLGPNGAGKSTTIKMFSGILTPTSGSIQVMGIDPTKNRKKHASNIGVMYGQRSQLWWDLPLIKSFELLQAIYKISNHDYKERCNYFIEILNLQEFINQPVRQLSLGQRIKGELVATLLHAPPIVFLDEPTIGLDVLAKDQIQSFLKMINKEQKVTIILTSHNMDDIEKLCNRVVMIDHGKVMFDGTKDQLKSNISSKKVLTVEVDTDSISVLSDIIPKKIEDNKFIFEIEADIEVPRIIQEVSNHHKIIKIEIEENNIEDVVRELYESMNSKAKKS